MNINKYITNVSVLFLALPFIYALMFPLKNINFIRDTSIMLFLAEFISILSYAILFDKSPRSTTRRILALMLITTFCSALMKATTSPFVFFYLVVSIFTKYFISKEKPDVYRFAKNIAVYVLSLFIVVVTSPLLSALIPIPKQFINSNGGLFFAVPQTILFWGILYPIGLFLMEFVKLPLKISFQK